MVRVCFALCVVLALAAPRIASADPSVPGTAVPTAPASTPFTVEVTVDGMAYTPAQVKVPAGVPLRLVFLKKDWSGCTREVVFAALGVRATLETGKPVPVDLPPQPKGTVEFACGMGMVKGSLVVE
jgi:plastocyanin domain-containing protein